MLKAKSNDGHVLIGLSYKNLELLRAGRPIVIDTAEMYLDRIPPQIFIFAASTEEQMMRDLERAGMVDADAKVHTMGDDPQSGGNPS